MHRLHHELDDRHWWFAARRQIVLRVLDDALAERGPDAALKLLDIGCGGGGTLRELARRGEAFGLDPEPTAVTAAVARSGCEVRLGGLPDDVPFEAQTFDVVTLLDVLEHIWPDERAVRAIARLLRPDGLLLCTVPAFRFLWGQHDVVNIHARRYTRPLLRTRLERAGLRVRKLTYYNTFLFPGIAAVRLLRPTGRQWRPDPDAADAETAGAPMSATPAGADEARPDLGEVPAPVNAVLRGIFAAERHWLRLGNFPFGVSVLALAQKPGGAA